MCPEAIGGGYLLTRGAVKEVCDVDSSPFVLAHHLPITFLFFSEHPNYPRGDYSRQPTQNVFDLFF